jgi:1,4-alpha-glucan branching enzyme
MTAKLTVPRKSIAEGAANLVLREMKIDGLRVDPIMVMLNLRPSPQRFFQTYTDGASRIYQPDGTDSARSR